MDLNLADCSSKCATSFFSEKRSSYWTFSFSTSFPCFVCDSVFPFCSFASKNHHALNLLPALRRSLVSSMSAIICFSAFICPFCLDISSHTAPLTIGNCHAGKALATSCFRSPCLCCGPFSCA